MKAIDQLRRLKPDSESVHYLYIVNKDNKLIANLSLRDLIIAQPATMLHDIMNRDIIYVSDDEEIENLNEIISKYNLFGIPVVDNRMTLIGIVLINDVVHNLLKSKRRKR
ncbi:CBS domain-containing protein [Neobacillus pocheonensis]|uniref:CBS domain-containing protein n=1 Tax=Neobacillus pocheonensis TaxID=363869 RepID=A0ABT0WDY0_9BACI|nr:CBS domain-containing protein [Neobacillus pocheonensis]